MRTENLLEIETDKYNVRILIYLKDASIEPYDYNAIIEITYPALIYFLSDLVGTKIKAVRIYECKKHMCTKLKYEKKMKNTEDD